MKPIERRFPVRIPLLLLLLLLLIPASGLASAISCSEIDEKKVRKEEFSFEADYPAVIVESSDPSVITVKKYTMKTSKQGDSSYSNDVTIEYIVVGAGECSILVSAKDGTIIGTFDILVEHVGDPVDIPETKPTCGLDGSEGGKTCSVCGGIMEDPIIIPATGHMEMIEPGYPATETEEGLTDEVYCNLCGKTLKPHKVIPRIGSVPSPDPEAENPDILSDNEPSEAESGSDAAGNVYDALLNQNGTDVPAKVSLLCCGIAESRVLADGQEYTVPTDRIQFAEGIARGKKLIVINAPNKGEATFFAGPGTDKTGTCLTGVICPVLEIHGRYVKIDYMGTVGYVKDQAVAFYPAQDPKGVGEIAADQSVTMHMTQSKKGKVLMTVVPGTRLNVLNKGKTWTFVELNGFAGFIMTEYIRFE